MSDESFFPSQAAALRWLQGEGYSIQKSKFNKDVHDGFPALAPDGKRLPRSMVEKYAMTLGGSTAGRPAQELSEDTLRLQAAKAAERTQLARIAEMKADRLAGKLISREDMEQRVALAVVLLRTSMNQWITTTAPFVVETARGDLDRARALLERLVSGDQVRMPEALREEARQVLDTGARDRSADVVELLREASREWFHGFSGKQLFELDMEDVRFPEEEDCDADEEDDEEDDA